jgi:plasmid replication initiation protein
MPEREIEDIDIQKGKSPLLPVRHPNQDFFVCDIFNAAPKADIASMEHPIFSLSTKPDKRERRYEHNGNFIEIKPSSQGLATIHDRDILIYCISQLMSAIKDGREVTQTVRFKAVDLLTATNRMNTGTGYALLKNALERLRGTSISTNILTGGVETLKIFGLIENAEIIRQTRDGRMQEIEVKLSDWVFKAITAKEVLTLHRNYFRLRKPIERRIYELGRKHCGQQEEWKISLDLLRKKCGSCSSLKEFKRLVQVVVKEDQEHNHMPDYALSMSDEDMVVFRNKNTAPKNKEQSSLPLLSFASLDPETYHDARTIASGFDVYELERQWREWIAISGSEPPRNPDAAFLGFCRQWVVRRQKS